MSLDLSRVKELEFKVTDNQYTNQTAVAVQGKIGGKFAHDILVVFEKDGMGLPALMKALEDYCCED